MQKQLNILALEPFYGGSHKLWLEGLKQYSTHHIELMTLPGRLWKWRMNGAAVTFAKRCQELERRPDLFLATDILDVATFRGLLPQELRDVPLITYFHENQFAYPWQSKPKSTQHDIHHVQHFDLQYLFKNYTTALSSDFCYFNSRFNLESFLEGLRQMLKKLPDHTHSSDVSALREKFEVLPLGFTLPAQTPLKKGKKIVWNHRWEFDKNPEEFFAILRETKNLGEKFHLSLLGTRAQKYPAVFDEACEEFGEEMEVFNRLETREDYLKELESGTVALTTSQQEFFGISVIEAINAGNLPLLPHRLSYPEIIPQKMHSTFLYKSREEAVDKLRQFLASPLQYAHEFEELQRTVQKYRWPVMIQKYDERFLSHLKSH